MRLVVRTAIFIILASGFHHLTLSAACLPLSEVKSRQLAEYVQKKFAVPLNLTLTVESEDPDPASCFRKLHFRAPTSAGPPVDISLFLSPDQQFLTRELLDSSVDPLKERRIQERAVQRAISDGDLPALGSEKAPVTITVFSDFQCPLCKTQFDALRAEKSQIADGVLRVQFRNPPLSMHPWAAKAAEAAACIYQQSGEGFWKAHDYMFTHQDQITVENVVDKLEEAVISDLKLKRDDYRLCLANGRGAERVAKDLELAKKYDIRSTPTVFVNGLRRNGATSVEELKALIAVVQKLDAAK